MHTTPLLRLAFTLMAIGFVGMGWAVLGRSTGAGVATLLMAVGPLAAAFAVRLLGWRWIRVGWAITGVAGLAAALFYGMAGQWVNAFFYAVMGLGFGGVAITGPLLKPPADAAQETGAEPQTKPGDAPAGTPG